MNLTLNPVSVPGIAAAALALLLFVKVALSPSADLTGKRLLLLFVAGLLGMALNSLYFLLDLHLVWPHLSFLWLFLLAWIGPSFYFYTRRVLGLAVFPLSGRSVWHWLPGIVLQLCMLPYLLSSAQDKLDFIYDIGRRWVFLGMYLSIYVHIAAYVYLCQRALRQHRAALTAAAEKELRVDLDWINIVSYGFVAFVFMDGVLPNVPFLRPFVSYAVALTLYLVIIVVVFHATTHGRVYPFGVGDKARSDPKYVNSGLRDDTARHYLGKLERLMQDEQPHLDSELSLDKLAALVRIHPHYLSQVLNDHVGKNFYDFVNEHRIAHARKLLVDAPDLPVVDVAIACGYNNKNSFYNSFRRFVGMTPSEFRQQNSVPKPERG